MEYLNVVNSDYEKVITSPLIYPKFKVELLDEYENAYCELTQDLSSQSVGSITCQLQSGVRQTVDFTIFDPTKTFLPNPNNKFFWIGRKFKIYLGVATERTLFGDTGVLVNASLTEKASDTKGVKVEDIDGRETDIYWFSKGIYIITGISASDEEGKVIAINGVDKFGAFGNETGYGEMVGTFALPVGTQVSQAIKEILR